MKKIIITATCLGSVFFSTNSFAMLINNALTTNALTTNSLLNSFIDNYLTLNGVEFNNIKFDSMGVNEELHPSFNGLLQPVFNNGFNGINTHGLTSKNKKNKTSSVW